jgi:hypothetical protein
MSARSEDFGSGGTCLDLLALPLSKPFVWTADPDLILANVEKSFNAFLTQETSVHRLHNLQEGCGQPSCPQPFPKQPDSTPAAIDSRE